MIGRVAARLTVALIAVSGCDSLVGEGYYGEPLFEVDGRIVDDRYPETTKETPTASLFWSLTGDPTVEPSELVAQPSVGVGLRFPSTFKLRVFDQPPAAALTGGRGFAVGEILIWNDDNGDGVYGRSELRGAAFNNVVLYTRSGLSAAESPTGLNLPAGFTIADVPLRCSEYQPDPAAEDCGVALGSACVGDTDCGAAGRCIHSDGFISFPGGYCVLPDDVPCIPRDGAYLVLEDGVVWGLACPVAGECPREDYQCLDWSGTCEPRAPVALHITPDLDFLQPLCVSDL